MDLVRNLGNEMAQDEIVIEYLKDVEIAKDFYRALCNVDWYVKHPPVPEDEQIIRKLIGYRPPYWSCSWRASGGIIAEIRDTHYNTSEDYMAFYCAGKEGTVTEQVRQCFDRMGWTPIIFTER